MIKKIVETEIIKVKDLFIEPHTGELWEVVDHQKLDDWWCRCKESKIGLWSYSGSTIRKNKKTNGDTNE